MWCTQVELQKRFCLGSTFVTKICRLIDANMDIYGDECKARKRYSPIAFYHAYDNYKALESGADVKPYDPDKIAVYLTSLDRGNAEEFFDAGIRRCRNELYEQLVQYFADTQIPKDSRQVAKAIKLAVLAIVTTGEVKGI